MGMEHTYISIHRTDRKVDSEAASILKMMRELAISKAVK